MNLWVSLGRGVEALDPGNEQEEQEMHLLVEQQKDALLDLDEAVRAVVLEGIKEKGSLAALQSATRGFITWERFALTYPYVPSRGFRDDLMTEGERSARDNLVVVFHASYRTRKGCDVHVLRHSFLPTRRDETRVRTSIYCVIRSAQSVLASELWNAYPSHQWNVCFVGNESPDLMGFVDQGKGLPGLLFAFGPFGTGGFINFNVFFYNPETEAWDGSRMVADFSGVGEFGYDETTQRLWCDAPDFDASTETETVYRRHEYDLTTLFPAPECDDNGKPKPGKPCPRHDKREAPKIPDPKKAGHE